MREDIGRSALRRRLNKLSKRLHAATGALAPASPCPGQLGSGARQAPFKGLVRAGPQRRSSLSVLACAPASALAATAVTAPAAQVAAAKLPAASGAAGHPHAAMLAASPPSQALAGQLATQPQQQLSSGSADIGSAAGSPAPHFEAGCVWGGNEVRQELAGMRREIAALHTLLAQLCETKACGLLDEAELRPPGRSRDL